MSEKIILNSQEPIVCPHCKHEFLLQDGITRQAIDRHTEEFDALLKAETDKSQERITLQAQERANESIKALQDQLSLAQKSEADARQAIESAKQEAVAKVKAEISLEQKTLQDEIERKNAQLTSFREQEMGLRKEKQALEEQKQNMVLDLQRRVDEERKLILEKEAGRIGLIEAEWKKKFDDIQKNNDDLRKKLEQGSQQLQGEVLELEIEKILSTSFYQDLIEEVKKGQRGADIIQTVRTQMGGSAGKIIWEAKRAENWSDGWIQKLKDDQQEAKADLAVLVTTAMPKGNNEQFFMVGDIWVISPQLVKPMAETLRVILLEMNRLQHSNAGRDEKVHQLYDYITSATFSQRIRAVFDTFVTMKTELESERRAILKIWSKRESQIDRMTASMGNVVGEIQGIARESLPELSGIDDLKSLAESETS
ncbi:MAG: DUF2130 domain-containing protein [Pseudomonadota bacterium]